MFSRCLFTVERVTPILEAICASVAPCATCPRIVRLSWREEVEPHVFLAEEENEEPGGLRSAQRQSLPVALNGDGLSPAPESAQHAGRDASVDALEVGREEAPRLGRGELDHSVRGAKDHALRIVSAVFLD
jgi:hypothetical protein